jgi:hypothetical protein
MTTRELLSLADWLRRVACDEVDVSGRVDQEPALHRGRRDVTSYRAPSSTIGKVVTNGPSRMCHSALPSVEA